MTVLLAIVLTTLHLEDDNLVALYERVHYFYYNFCTINSRCAYCDCALVVYEEHFVILNSLACFGIFDVVYEELLALFHLELLTVNFYDCVHFY